MATISKADIQKIGEISTHCDLVKLNIAITEARDFDLESLFCSDWDEIQAIFDKVAANDPEDLPTELEINLINGGEFTNCQDKTVKHKGITAVWSYYAYARYMMLNGFNDTPNGNVSKANDFSLPKPLKEIEMFADKYRSMAYASYRKTNNFMCRNKEEALFADFSLEDCESCGCGKGECTKGTTTAKGYGFRMKTIKKDIR